MKKTPSVILINMPWDFLFWPSIRLGLLKSVLLEKGIHAHVEYLNLFFIDFVLKEQKDLPSHLRLTDRDYFRLANEIYRNATGEWLFTHVLYDKPPCSTRKHLDYLRKSGVEESFAAKIKEVRKCIRPFLDFCLKKISWQKYDVVGFTSTFNQNIPSLALAKEIKRKFPACLVVFGGANCEGLTGEFLFKRFPWVDAVVRGEGEEVFPSLVKEYVQKGKIPSFPGLLFRENGKVFIDNSSTRQFYDLNNSPIPDYADYFSALSQLDFGRQVRPVLPLETSRGCWWGMKFHCSFCGLNQLSMKFRSKSPEKVLEEIQKIISRYHLLGLYSVDNVLDMKYFNTLLPEIEKLKLDLNIYIEVKTNLKKSQIQQLRDAGIRTLQAGVENLCTRHLSLLHKGTTMIQNVQFLKWCLEKEIFLSWNYLYAIPGEKPEEYSRLREVVRYLTHLPPPRNVTPVALERFSPYFCAPNAYRIKRIRPKPCYSFIYPWDGQDLFDAAYGFDYDYEFEGDPEKYTQDFREDLRAWREKFQPNLLVYSCGPGFLKITDSRQNLSPKFTILDKTQSEIYLFCDEARTLKSVLENLQKSQGKNTWEADNLLRFLKDMCKLNLMLKENDRYLSLAVPVNIDFAVSSLFAHSYQQDPH